MLLCCFSLFKTFQCHRYETDNGILAEENGRIERLESGDDGLRSSGYFQYTGDDGQVYRVDYVADDNGFVPKVFVALCTQPNQKKKKTSSRE